MNKDKINIEVYGKTVEFDSEEKPLEKMILICSRLTDQIKGLNKEIDSINNKFNTMSIRKFAEYKRNLKGQ